MSDREKALRELSKKRRASGEWGEHADVVLWADVRLAFDPALATPPVERAAEPVAPYGQVTTHSQTGQQFFYRWPQSPYLDNASECVKVYTEAQPERAAPAEQDTREALTADAADEMVLGLVSAHADWLRAWKVARTAGVKHPALEELPERVAYEREYDRVRAALTSNKGEGQ
jgi:hypothetical protein